MKYPVSKIAERAEELRNKRDVINRNTAEYRQLTIRQKKEREEMSKKHKGW